MSDREGRRSAVATLSVRPQRLPGLGPGRYEGESFYVWDEDEREAEAWGRALAGIRSPQRNARRSHRS